MADLDIAGVQEAIRRAAAVRSPLRIVGGATKDFYGEKLVGDVLDVRELTGIVDYEPNELVITARAGTPIDEIESAMRASGQMLAFEPPRFAPGGTLGGAIASGLSGPRRPYAGAARDIRKDTFKKVESFSSTEFDNFSTASLITRSTNDVTQVQIVIFMFIRMVI